MQHNSVATVGTRTVIGHRDIANCPVANFAKKDGAIVTVSLHDGFCSVSPRAENNRRFGAPTSLRPDATCPHLPGPQKNLIAWVEPTSVDVRQRAPSQARTATALGVVSSDRVHVVLLLAQSSQNRTGTN